MNMNKDYFTAYNHVYTVNSFNKVVFWMILLCVAALLFIFLPWNQSVRGRGYITTLKQEQRPQMVNTLIAGRIDRWFVKEGDYVKAGDTILKLSEIDPQYLDPELIQRTAEQLNAKESSIGYYRNKAAATANQASALGDALSLKLLQLKNKFRQTEMEIASDSMDLLAAANEWNITTLQLQRQQVLYDSGLVSLAQVEQRKMAFQSAAARKIGAENKLNASRQELGIVETEFKATQQEYREKMLKAEADRFGSMSLAAQTEAEASKLKNQYDSYRLRNKMYFVLAPQDGQIVQAVKRGIGESVKEGDMLVNIVPLNMDYAVEMYVRPVDLPLISAGVKVRFLFDGFPAIVFSGWPNASYGTYQGVINAVENDRRENGFFRVLVRQDTSYRKWPSELKVGTGANGIALLETVPVWYELWRMINSFPPDFYKPKKTSSTP